MGIERRMLFIAVFAEVACTRQAGDRSRLMPPGASASAPAASTPSTSVATPTIPTVFKAPVTEGPLTEGPLPWGTRPKGLGPFYPLVDGMCIHGTVFLTDNAALFSYGSSAGPYTRGGSTTVVPVGDQGLRESNSLGIGAQFDWSQPLAIGGRYPEKLFAVLEFQSRMWGAGTVKVGSASQEKWSVLEPLSTGEEPEGKRVAHRFRSVLRLRSDAQLLAEELFAAKDSSYTYRFRVLADDKLVSEPKLPGADLAQCAFRQGLVRLGNGEFLCATTTESHAVLVRWSPDRPVDDLKVKRGDPSQPTFLVANEKQAYLRVGRDLHAYDGGQLKRLPVKPIAERAQLAVLPTGLAIVVSGDRLTKVGPDGPATEETLPFKNAVIYGASTGFLWAVSGGTGAVPDTLYRRREGQWESVAVEDPPFVTQSHSPLRIEDVIVRAEDDVFLNVRRVEAGFGWLTSEPYRAIYRSKRPSQVLRCQDVRNDQTGVGVYPWPPTADDACRTPTVVLYAEERMPATVDAPELRALLKGRKEFGETLHFTSFPGRGYGHNFAVSLDDVKKARELAVLVARKFDQRPQVVCGTPPQDRSLIFNVASGQFQRATADGGR
jgi:hypothetical protein